MTGKELIKRYNDGDRDFSGADLIGSDLSGAKLTWATLTGANLRGASFSGSDLSWATLIRANLIEATLTGSNLSGANFSGSDLTGATLIRANLIEATLTGSTLIGAEIKDVKWPSPTMVLLADWGKVSDDLTRDLMRLDAACHPNPAAFDRWVDGGGPCPYEDVNVQRAASFAERKECWKPGRPPKIYNLMCRVLEEKCVLGG